MAGLIEELGETAIDIVKGRKYKVELRGRKHLVTLHSDTEDDGYWGECPSLPGCASQGDTVEEALEMIKGRHRRTS